MVAVPEARWWLCWDVDPLELDTDAHRGFLIPRVLEHGALDDVRWLLGTYGTGEVHRFLRDEGHPELSPRTLAFWRALLGAKDEPWASPRPSLPASAAPWPG